MKRLIILLLAIASVSTTALAADRAVQSSITNNVLVEGKLSADKSGEVVTIRLYDEDSLCYIEEIPVQSDGTYALKFKYNGDVSDLSFKAVSGGKTINETVTVSADKASLVEADVFLKNQDGGGIMIDGDMTRQTYNTYNGFTWTPEIELPQNTKAGVVIYPRNELGDDNTAYTVFLAQYDSENRLLSGKELKSDILSFDAISGKTGIDCGTVALDDGVKTVKAFLWDSETSIQPYEKPADGKLEATNLYLVGDSTYQGWSGQWSDSYPQGGIGSFVGDYFNTGYITVHNKGVSGSSAKSWLDNPGLGDWDGLLSDIKEGDYVYFGLGINDLCGNWSDANKAVFRTGMTKLVDDVMAKGAIPVLGSPILSGKEMPAYVTAAIDVLEGISAEKGICYLPIAETAKEEMASLTEDEALRKYHLIYNYIIEDWGLTRGQLDEHMNNALKNKTDDTMHINVRGADYYASVIKKTLAKSDLKLRFYLK